MRRAFAIAAAFALLALAVLLHTSIKDFLWAHPWLHSTIVVLPTIALAIFAYLEWLDAAEANTLRADANVLQARIADLTAQLDTERNKHLQQIAQNTQKSLSPADVNAGILRKHLGAIVSVTEGQGYWPTNPEIAQVSDNNIAERRTGEGEFS
jgi:hypothetical protein